MRTRARTYAISACICVCILVGGAVISEAKNEERNDMSNTFQLGQMVGGKMQIIGEITFDDNDNGVLKLIADGPEADRLRDAWKEVQTKDVLKVRRDEDSVDADGNEFVNLVGIEFKRDDPDFAFASVEYLAQEHGFFMTPP